jgi:hypothetical protein
MARAATAEVPKPAEHTTSIVPPANANLSSEGPISPPALHHPMDVQIPEELQGYTGFETIDPSAFVIPRMKIVQPTSKEGTQGRLRINLTGDEFAALDVVIVKAMQGRVLWDHDNAGNEKPLCRSSDYLHPDSSIENPPSPECARQVTSTTKKTMLKPICPNAGWNGNEKPACGETWNLLCIQKDEFLPFWLSLAGTSIAPVRRYLSAIALRRCPLWQFETVISTDEQKGDRGRYFVVKFESPKPITRELEEQLIPMVAELKNADIKRTFDAEEELQADDGADGGNGGGGGGQSHGTAKAAPEEPGWMKG